MLSKQQLDENLVIVIFLLPLKATSGIWIYPGLTFKLRLAVFNCTKKVCPLLE